MHPPALYAPAAQPPGAASSRAIEAHQPPFACTASRTRVQSRGTSQLRAGNGGVSRRRALHTGMLRCRCGIDVRNVRKTRPAMFELRMSMRNVITLRAARKFVHGRAQLTQGGYDTVPLFSDARIASENIATVRARVKAVPPAISTVFCAAASARGSAKWAYVDTWRAPWKHRRAVVLAHWSSSRAQARGTRGAWPPVCACI